MNTDHDHDHLDDGTCLDGYLIPPPLRDNPLYQLAKALTIAESGAHPTRGRTTQTGAHS